MGRTSGTRELNGRFGVGLGSGLGVIDAILPSLSVIVPDDTCPSAISTVPFPCRPSLQLSMMGAVELSGEPANSPRQGGVWIVPA
jgi:hypothetical protein